MFSPNSGPLVLGYQGVGKLGSAGLLTVNKVPIGTHPHPFIYVSSTIHTTVQHTDLAELIVTTKSVWSTKPQIFTISPFIKKLCCPCHILVFLPKTLLMFFLHFHPFLLFTWLTTIYPSALSLEITSSRKSSLTTPHSLYVSLALYCCITTIITKAY